ncbi:MAG TPA: hypothetical protein VF550_13820 [Polyangia bacterium]
MRLLLRDGLAALVLLCCCSSPSQPVAPAVNPAVAHAPAVPEASKEAPKEAAKIDDEDLKIEEREANPYSETVNLKLSVTPQVKALVTWGAKQVAHLAPGSMDAEISRPRGSGPVDLEIKAEGFMPYHTRLYADRSDKIGVRLYRLEDASGMLGYKRSAEKKAPAGEKKALEKKK